MGNLPTARPRTYVDGMPLIPDDINEAFDAIIGSKHKLMTLSLPLTGMVNAISAGAPPILEHGSAITWGVTFSCSTQTIGAQLAVMIPKGTRIVNARFYVKDVAGQPPLTCYVLAGIKAISGGSTALGPSPGWTSSAGDGTSQTVERNDINYVLINDDGPVFVAITTVIDATGTYEVRAIELDIDRL